MGFQVRLRAIQWYRKGTLQSIQQPRRFSRMSLNHQCPLLLPGWSFVSCCFSMQPSITLTVPQAILNYCFLVGWFVATAMHRIFSPQDITASSTPAWVRRWDKTREDGPRARVIADLYHRSDSRKQKTCKVFKEFYCLSLKTTDRKGRLFLLSPRRLGFAGKILYGK